MNFFNWWKPQTPKTPLPGPAYRISPLTFDLEKACRPIERPIVFDPALQHCQKAFRAGEPQFIDAQQAADWNRIRVHMLQHTLRRIQESGSSSHLVLRGSALMASWFGEQARRPGDLDFVVVPCSWKTNEAESLQLIRNILQAMTGPTPVPGINFLPHQSVIEEIWLYARAPGKRVVLPWNSENPMLSGTIQLDFVFQEEIPMTPVETLISLDGSAPVAIQGVTREQSFAWKLQWLLTDTYALGKDLYDAVLLAESSEPQANVVLATLEPALRDLQWGIVDRLEELRVFQVEQWGVEWAEFLKEYPHVSGTAETWLTRLSVAMKDLFPTLEKAFKEMKRDDPLQPGWKF